jgi:ABC-type lipopolysaccharide export system ATPase subunit
LHAFDGRPKIQLIDESFPRVNPTSVTEIQKQFKQLFEGTRMGIYIHFIDHVM